MHLKRIYILNKLSLKYFAKHKSEWHRILSVAIEHYIRTNQHQSKQKAYIIILPQKFPWKISSVVLKSYTGFNTEQYDTIN